MRTIVAGVDVEAEGDVLLEASQRARAENARLLIVHGYRDLGQAWLANDALSAVAMERRHCEARIATVAATLRVGGVDAQEHVRIGRPGPVLARVAHEHQADVIIIGAGRSRRTRRLGVARSLARLAPCPVLLVVSGASDPHRRGARTAPAEKDRSLLPT